MKHTRSHGFRSSHNSPHPGSRRLLQLTAILLLCLMVTADMTPVFAAGASPYAKAGYAKAGYTASADPSGQSADPNPADPETDPGAVPGTDPASDPDADSGASDPGTDSGTVDPGAVDPGTVDPGTDPDATDPGTDPDADPDGENPDSDPEPGEGEDPDDPPLPPWTPADGLPKLKDIDVMALNDTQLLVTWTAAEIFEGYQVSYAKNVLFIRRKTTTLTDGTVNNLTLDGLTTSKRYYVRVRGYKLYEGKKYYGKWVTVKSNNAASKVAVRYVEQNGSKVDIRKLAGGRLDGYSIAQGTCSDGKYLYMAFEQRNGDDNGSSRARIKIAKVRISDWTVRKVSASGQKLGHANDIAYNPDDGILVVTGAKTNDPYVRVVSPKSLKKTATKKVRLKSAYTYIKAFNAIDYDPNTHTYFIRSRLYGGKSFTLNRNFKQVDVSTMSTVFPSRHVQSSTSTGSSFLIPQSWYQSTDKNTVTIFDKTGKQLQHIALKLSGELESLFFIGEQLYATVHKHISSAYKTCFIFKILL